MTTALRPCGARLICKYVEVEEHYPGSPIVLMTDRLEHETRQQAEVVAVGDVSDPRLQPGTWILHEALRRVPMTDDLFLVAEDDVVAIMES